MDLPEGWKELSVSSLISRSILEVGDGYRAKNSEMDAEGLPFVRAGNLNNGFQLDGADLLGWKSVEKAGAKVSRFGDSVMTSKGTFGRVGFVRNDTPCFIYSPQLVYWRVNDESVVDRHFLNLWLQGPHFLQQAYRVKSSTDMADYASLTDLRKFSILAPDIDSQKKIASILSAYDDLIENNKRRIALLEKMAEEIYREWFVRMRFSSFAEVSDDKPGAEKVKGLPKGWGLIKIDQLAKEVRDGIKKQDLSDETLYVGLEHLPRKSISLKEWTTADTVNSNKLRFQKRDILFGKIRPYLHKLVLSHVAGACSTDTIVLRPTNTIYEGFILFTLFSESFIELATIASKGTKMPRADWDFLKKQQLPVPPVTALKQYQDIFATCFAEVEILLAQNQRLQDSRDLLLPRLISGKLSVENISLDPVESAEQMTSQSVEAVHA